VEYQRSAISSGPQGNFILFRHTFLQLTTHKPCVKTIISLLKCFSHYCTYLRSVSVSSLHQFQLSNEKPNSVSIKKIYELKSLIRKHEGGRLTKKCKYRGSCLIAALFPVPWWQHFWHSGNWPLNRGWLIHALSPNSDENETSLYTINSCSNIQVMRIKKVISKGKMSWYLHKFSLLVQ